MLRFDVLYIFVSHFIMGRYDKDGDGKVYFTDVEGEGCYMDEQQYTKWRETILQGEKINIY